MKNKDILIYEPGVRDLAEHIKLFVFKLSTKERSLAIH